MTPRSGRSDSAPLTYVKYAFGFLAVFLVVPAFLQAALAFVQTFVQTLLSIVLTLNLLVLSAVTGAVRIWWWRSQMRSIETLETNVIPSGGGEPMVAENPSAQIALPTAVTSQPEVAVETKVSEPTAVPEEPVLEQQSLALAVEELENVEKAGIAEGTDDRPQPDVTPDGRSEVSKMSPDVPEVPTDSPKISCESPLIQAQLARRLGVSSSTIGTRKLRADFTAWSCQKDPEQVAWRYCEEARQFFVVSA